FFISEMAGATGGQSKIAERLHVGSDTHAVKHYKNQIFIIFLRLIETWLDKPPSLVSLRMTDSGRWKGFLSGL
ncbi:hypothetical protein H009_09491, partial [Agrobacterium tumefaciens str. Cherry 2E-2-2]